MKFRIVEYKDISEIEYIDYIEEWEQKAEHIVPSATKRNGASFNDLLNKWTEDMTNKMYKKGFVPSTLYFMIDDSGRILGAIHFRHELNKRLFLNGGHIGYGIRPSERKKGYATIMLNMLLELLKDKGYAKVLVTCDDYNNASARTIENNKGILYDKPLFEGVLTRRYWINL